MKYTEEDGVITAIEARQRVNRSAGEDSEIRQPVREIMGNVKQYSGYGYELCHVRINKAEGVRLKTIIREIEELGYKCKELQTDKNKTVLLVEWN